MICSYFKRILNFLSFASFPIALSAIGLSIAYAMLLSESIAIQRVIVNGLGTFIIYNLVQLIPVYYKNHLNQKSYWFKSNSKILLLLIIIAIIILISQVEYLSRLDLINYFHLTIICLIYEIPSKFGLRKIPYLKSLIISYIWTMCIVFPNFYSAVTPNNLLYLIEFFIYILALALAFDFRDREFDLEENIKTIVNFVSEKNARILIFVLYTISACLLMIIIGINTYTIAITGVHLIVLMFLNKNNNQFYYLIGIDGLMLLKSFFLWYSA